MKSSKLAALPALVGATVAVVLWGGARDTNLEPARVVLHGTGTYRRVVQDVEPAGLLAGFLVLGAGIALSFLVLLWAPRARLERILAAGALVVVVAVGVRTFDVLYAASGVSLESPERFAGGMASAGLECDPLHTEATGATDHFKPGRAVCAVPSAIAYDDGHEDVVVRFFHGAPARFDWLREARDGERVLAVAGPDWMAACEFRVTCDLIHTHLGGVRLTASR